MRIREMTRDTGRMLLLAGSSILLLLAVQLTGPALADASVASARPEDPVVLKGGQVDRLGGINPNSLVAFRSTGSIWHQIPIQVDERKVVNVKSLYAGTNTYIKSGTFNLEIYADSSTRSGADTDASLDSNDEIVFMAGDSGENADHRPLPSGVVADSGVRVTINDPIGGGMSYVYLFRSDGSLNQAPDDPYVEYEPELLLPGGSYKDNYDYFFPLNGSPPANGYNPEDSTVTTDAYEFRSRDRWLDDELRIKVGGATGIDILDREKVATLPFACTRSEDTFTGRAVFHTNDNGEGTFIANISGPVRAIRSYMGANSGPFTQREHVFYRTRQEVRTFLRVHSGMPVLSSLVDYSAAASGMTYRNELYPPGMLVDGTRDYVNIPPDPTPRELTLLGYPLSGGKLSTWEQVTGAQGTINILSRVDTDISNLEIAAFHMDEANTNPNSTVVPGYGRLGADETYQCTGDNQAFATSGMMIKMPGDITDSSIPNTDPHLGTARNLTMTRLYDYGAPGQGQADAQARKAEVDQPVSLSVAAFDPVPVDPADEFNLVLDQGLLTLGSVTDAALNSPVTIAGTVDPETGVVTVPSENVSAITADLPGPAQATFVPSGTHLAGTWTPNGKVTLQGPVQVTLDLPTEDGDLSCYATTRLQLRTDQRALYDGARFTGGLSGTGALAARWDSIPNVRGDTGCAAAASDLSGPGGMLLSR